MSYPYSGDYDWQSAKDEFQSATLPLLKQHGPAIGDRARAGDKKAQEVMRLYGMLHRSFDPLTADRLRDALAAAGVVK